jgi:hypothetical protein
MFGRWLKRSNRLDHADSAIRLTALEELSDEERDRQQPKLVEMALDDVDLDVRRRALALVQAPDQIAKLLDDPDLQTEAATLIWAAIRDGQPSVHAGHPQVIEARINSAEPQDLDALLRDLEDPAQIATLALRFKDDAREQILQSAALMTEAGLAVLERTTRSKDKTCNRYARDQLDNIRSARSECAEATARLEEIDTAIVKELRYEAPDMASQIVQHDKLKTLAKRRSKLIRTIAEANEALRQYHIQSTSVPADPLAEFDWSEKQTVDPFAELVQELDQLAQRIDQQEAPDTLAPMRNSIAERWLALADLAPPGAAQHQRFERVSHDYLAYVKRHEFLSNFDWPSLALPQASTDEAELFASIDAHRTWQKRYRKFSRALDWPPELTPPAPVTQLSADADSVQTSLDLLTDRHKQMQAEQGALLQQIEVAIEQGQTQQALQHMRRARALQKIGLKSENKALNALSARLKELEDWQHFATDPKREGLLVELQAIADQPLDAPAQLKKIKAIREQWRGLGPIRGAHDAQLREQFEQAAETAFEHCKSHLDEQARLRAENLAQREALCAQLTSYLEQTDWAGADMNAAEQIMRTARQEWRRFHPCDRKQLKPVEARFEEVQQQLHDRVKLAWDTNIEQKNTLIEQAQALLDGPVEAQVDGIKALQSRWREVGPVPRGVDQRLWREFRKLCDQVFVNRDDARKVADEQWQAINQRVDAQLDTITEALAAARDINPGMLRDWRQQVEETADGIRLNAGQAKRLRQIEQDFQAKLADHRKRSLEDEVVQFKTWDIEVSQLEREAAEQATSNSAPHPIFAQRVARTASPEPWLRLTLEAEIAADIPSPPEDQGERMALQVELMNQGVRQENVSPYKELLLRWCAAGPKDAEADELRERFFAAIAQRL